MRILICSFYFPPTGGGGVQRALKFAQRLPELVIKTRVVVERRIPRTLRVRELADLLHELRQSCA